MHARYAELCDIRASIGRDRDALGNTLSASTPEYEALCARWLSANDRVLTCCPSCGGTRSRYEGAKGYHCRACTRRTEYAHTGPF